MDDIRKKWLKFGYGVCPTLLFILMAYILPKTDAGPTIFFAALAYLAIGLTISSRLGKAGNDNKSLTAGVLSGFFASFILSATLCFSSIG